MTIPRRRRLAADHPLALVTGSAGFVGRHMLAALVDLGYAVDTVDLVDGGNALDIFRHGTESYDLVIHAAAVVGGRTMIEGRPLELAAIDLELDAALWRWAQRTRPGRVVYFSSSAAYPVRYQTVDVRAWLREDYLDPVGDLILAPDATYGLVKLVGERLAVEARNDGIPVTVVRPFSGYGDDQALDYPFPTFIDRAARHADPFDVWGTGEQVRDFVHIDDIVSAVMRLVELEVDGPVNIGTGRPTSFLELAAICQRSAGYTGTIRPHPSAPTGVAWRVANVDELHRYYTPTITLEAGIARALDAHPSHRARADAS